MIKTVYHFLPEVIKSEISKLNYWLQNKPQVLVNSKSYPLPRSAKGGVIISADLELGWAVRYSKERKDPVLYAERERQNVPIILRHLDRFKIPIVWSTVGHLFLEHCKKGDHDWMRRIPYFSDHWEYTSGDWFDCDSHTNYKADSTWYAPDLVESILNSKANHEIACHTFSHIDCSYKNCPSYVLEDELIASIDAARQWGVKFRSITFPGGFAGNYEVLRKFGIRMCRKRYYGYEIAYPFMNDYEMIVSPTGPSISMAYSSWSMNYRLSRIKKAIDKAIHSNSVVHFWFHPSQERETFSDFLPLMLKYCAEKREEGTLWIGTMDEFVDFVDNNQIQLVKRSS